MRYIIFYILLILSLGLSASQPLKIGVISDTHYLSERLMDDGNAINNYIASSGKNIKAVPQVLDQVLAYYNENKPDILLVSGDMTKDGEKQSHLDFRARLKPLQDRGTKVFVIPGNHDINMPNAVRFEGDKAEPVDNVSPQEFADIYKDCGYGTALKRDTASLSYVAQLDNGTWLLAIDVARYKEYTTRSLSSGKLSPETEKWVIEILDEAKEKNIQVLGMMHWGLVEHIMYQSTFFKDYLVDDWQRLAPLFADKGMKAIFTGHFHANDITAFTSDNGNTIYDIETGTLCSYPFSYRSIDYSPTSMNISTFNVMSIPQDPSLAVNSKIRMEQLSERLATQKISNMGFGLPDTVVSRMAKVMGQVFVQHAYGDEKMTDDMRKWIQQLSLTLDSPVDMNDIELDFFPADNNITITF
ncbi:metallophosphoesterase [Dysgonomonas sp. ZJ709]|uniref:metallophosphoesterase family protein n=1 Tax=Dysgonomonas sp. ZJ709 TaxID=2709797 RepID=UPI0013EAFE2C|nr:metallophosphoesterase [Dysgonomonas sp. ZJ709]